MDVLIKDGVKYFQSDLKGKEDVFEKIVFEQQKYLFGENSILFTKQKIKTATGIGTIPDAFILDFENDKWFIIEVEISNHDVYTHIVPQLTKFASALNNSQTRKHLIKFFESEIKNDPFKNALLLSNKKSEIFKTVSEIVETSPELIIIIEQEHDELKSIFNSLPFKTKISVFKIFTRNGLDAGENVFQFEPLFTQSQKKIFKTEVKNETSIQLHKTVDTGNIPAYAKSRAKELERGGDTLTNKMLNYIRNHKTVTWVELKKTCVKEFGYKETSGSIAGSLNTLQHLNKIRIEGRGDKKKISINE